MFPFWLIEACLVDLQETKFKDIKAKAKTAIILLEFDLNLFIFSGLTLFRGN